MKVVISVGGRFHAFDLASQLECQGHLRRLITSYPKFIAARWGIPRDKVASIFGKEVATRAYDLLPGALRRLVPDFWLADNFDKRAAQRIPKDADIFVGWSYFSMYSLQQAKGFGMVTVLDHGSSHIEHQRDMVNEEYERWGMRPPITDNRPVRKEIAEYEKTDYIALPSRFAVRTFLEKGVPESKILHVPYGVDLGSFQQVRKSDKTFRIVFVGSLSLLKGVHYLLQGFAELDMPDSELLLVGKVQDEIRPFLKKYSKCVRSIGAIPQAELHKYYSESSVVVRKAIDDGFGMVIVQAMACGLPVIATTNTGGEDIIRDGKDGFIIPIRDVEALKEKLLYLYENPEARQEMGASAKARVATGFTWDDYGRSMIKEYERILQKDADSHRISS